MLLEIAASLTIAQTRQFEVIKPSIMECQQEADRNGWKLISAVPLEAPGGNPFVSCTMEAPESTPKSSKEA